MKRYLFYLFISCSLLLLQDCKKRKNISLTVYMDSVVTAPKPFLLYAIATLPDTSRIVKIRGIDSTIVYNIVFQSFDGDSSSMIRSIDDTVLMVAGIRKKDKKVVTFVDANRDKSIADEKESLLTDTSFLAVKNLEYFDGKKIVRTDFYLRPVVSEMHIEVEGMATGKIKPFDDPSVVVMANYRYGRLNKDNEIYKFALFNYLQGKYDKETSFMVAVPLNKEFPDPRFGIIFHKIGDFFYLGDKRYKFLDVSEDGSNITIEQVPYKGKKIGNEEGYFAYNIEGNDILTTNLFNLSNSHKYILLDFWGTWCGPCVATIPKLKLLNTDRERYNLEIVSIACQDDLKKVKQAVMSKAITWTNLFDDTVNNNIESKYRVSAFPTFILIGPDGKILKRGSSENALDEIKNFLETQKFH